MIEGQEGVTWPQWLALAEACEQHGISTLFRSDHYLNLGGNLAKGSLDAWATLSGLAAVTTKLRLGTMVSPATFRHPSELAKVVATADQISGGRIDLGLGAGWHEPEHTAYGFTFPPVKDRMDVLEEQLQIVLGNWSDGPFSFEGDHYRLTALEAEPKPVQKPHPPVIMGGIAGPRAARLAAAYADEYNTVFATPDDIRDRKGRIDAACERVGRQPMPFSLMTTVIIGSDDQDLRRRAATVAAIHDQDGDALIDDPPPGWVVGLIEPAAEQLRGLAAAGVARVMCQHLAHDDVEFVELLGGHVAPLLG